MRSLWGAVSWGGGTPMGKALLTGGCGSGSQGGTGPRAVPGGHLVLSRSWTWGRRPDASSRGAGGSFPTRSGLAAQRDLRVRWPGAGTRPRGPQQVAPQRVPPIFSLGLGVSRVSSFHRSLFYRSPKTVLRVTESFLSGSNGVDGSRRSPTREEGAGSLHLLRSCVCQARARFSCSHSLIHLVYSFLCVCTRVCVLVCVCACMRV